MQRNRTLTWRVFATSALVICVFTCACISYIVSDQFAQVGFSPGLALPIIIGAFSFNNVQKWFIIALWSALGLISAQMVMAMLGFEIYAGLLSNEQIKFTDLRFFLLEIMTEILLAAGIAFAVTRILKITPGDVGLLRSINIEDIFTWRFFLVFLSLPIYTYVLRSFEAGVMSSYFGLNVKVWFLIRSDIFGYFAMLNVIFGAFLTFANVPRLEPDIRPIWVLVLAYFSMVVCLCAAVAIGIIETVSLLLLCFSFVTIFGLLSSSLQVSGLLLLLNFLGLFFTTQFIAVNATEMIITALIASSGTLVVMLLRLIAQLKLSKAHAQTEVYLRAGTGAFAIMSEEQEFLYVSEQFLKMTEYESIEALPHIRQMIVDLSSEEHVQLHARVRAVETGVLKLPTRINTLKTKSGREIKIERSIRWFEIHGEEKRRLSVSYQDVTEKIRLEVERADQEEVLNAFVYDGPQYCFVEDEEFKIRLISEGASELIAGKPSAELIGKDPLEYFCPDNQKRIMAARLEQDERLERGETVVSETPLTFERGEDIVKVRVQVKLLRLPSGAVMRGIIFDDITKVEQARQRAENYLNAGTSLFFIRGEDFKLAFVSEPLISRLGYENFAEVPPSEYWRYDPAAVSKAREFYKSKPLNETFKLPDVVEIRTKQGDKLSFIETFKWFEDPVTQSRLLMTSYEDVSDSEQNRQNAIRLLNQANAYLQNGIDAYVIKDIEFRNVFVSEEFISLTGYDQQSFSTAENFYLEYENEDRVLQRPPTDKSVMGQRIDLGVCRIRCKDGSKKTVHRFSRLFQGLDENNLILIAFVDITELEQARQQAEDYLQAGTGSFVIQNERFETLYVSEKVFDLVSQENVNLINGGDSSSLLKFWSDFDHFYWVKHRQEINALKTGDIWESPEPERVLTSSAEERYIIRRRRWFASNKERLLYTELQDVTEITRALEIANRFLDSQLTAFSIQNEDFSFYYISDEFKKIFNIETFDEIGDPARGFWQNRDESFVQKDRERLLSLPTNEISDEPEPFVYSQASGEKLSFKVKSKWILNPVGEGRLLITSFADVTSLENALQEAQTYLEGNVNAYVVQDESWQYVYASEQFLKLIGVQDITSIPEAEVLFPEINKSKLLQIRDDWTATEFGVLIETPLILSMHCPSGELKQVKRSARKIKRQSGEGFLTVVGYEDQTELQRALSAANKFLESQMTAFVIQKEDFSFYYVSNEFLRLCNVSTVEDIGDPAKGFWFNRDENSMNANRKRLRDLPTGEINEENEIFIFVTSSGERLSFMAKSRWILDPAGDGRLLITAFEDVTKIEEQRAQLDHLSKTAELYLESGINAYGIQNEKFEHLYLSKAFTDLTGYTVDTMPMHSDFYPDYDPTKAKWRREKLSGSPNGKIVHSGTHKVRTKDGNILWMSRSARWFNGISGERLLMVSFEDHTALVEEREFTQSLIEGSSALIITQTNEGKIQSISTGFAELLGYSKDALLGSDIVDLYVEEDRQIARKFRIHHKAVGFPDTFVERRLVTARGDVLLFNLNLRAAEGSTRYETIITATDLTKERAAQAKIQAISELDELTGLYSRRGLKNRFGVDQRYKDNALLLLDIDHFKSVNDGYGHEAGDQLLIAIADVLKQEVRTEGACVRLGGEELALLIPWEGWDAVYAYAEKIREKLGQVTIISEGRSVQRSVSIGVAMLGQTASISEVLKLSDMALREAKEGGRNCCVFADEETMNAFEERGMFIQAKQVQFGLENEEFEYFLQPIIDISTNSTVGYEALIRWRRKNGIILEPDKFINLLNEVIRQPAYQAMKQDLRGKLLEKIRDVQDPYVAFNYNLESLGYPGAANKVHGDLQKILDTEDRKIVIELSEKALHARVNEEILIEELSLLQRFGYKIALDDFGIESSNLKRLQTYPVDIVKIDQSLVEDITESDTSRRLLDALSTVFVANDLTVVVEGVETAEQAQILKEIGLYYQQGFLHQKPYSLS